MAELVLVADSDPFSLRLLQELCEAASYRVATAMDGLEVLDAIARERPDVVLLDAHMPRVDGLEILRILKADDNLAKIPVLLVTPRDDVESRSRALHLGAEDYVGKPYRVFEVQRRIQNALRAAAHGRPPSQPPMMPHPGSVDPITGASNAAQLSISLDYELTRGRRYGHPLSLILVHIENLDALAATDGGGVEGALAHLSVGLRLCIRAVDGFFRPAHDEFALLLPETDLPGAQTVADRIHTHRSDGSLWERAVEPTPRVRVGLASMGPDEADEGDVLYRSARKALT